MRSSYVAQRISKNNLIITLKDLSFLKLNNSLGTWCRSLEKLLTQKTYYQRISIIFKLVLILIEEGNKWDDKRSMRHIELPRHHTLNVKCTTRTVGVIDWGVGSCQILG